VTSSSSESADSKSAGLSEDPRRRCGSFERPTLGGPDDYVVRVMHERVFRFMHRI